MKKILTLLVILIILQPAMADEITYNGSDAPVYPDSNLTVVIPNDTAANLIPNITLPEVNLSDINLSVNLSGINLTETSEELRNASQTGVGPIDQIVNFLYDASPFLLLIAGIALVVLSGFGKMIGIVLILLALIRFAWIIFT